MLRVYECLTIDHDLRLVLVAALVCVFGVYTTMAVAARSVDARQPLLWPALTALCAGATIWATHFVAMLAYLADLPLTYDPGLTFLSFAAGTGVMWGGFHLAMTGRAIPRRTIAGGLIIGAGVVVLHYVGMSAIRIPGRIAFDADLVAASVVFSLGLGAAAAHVGFARTEEPRVLGGAVLLLAMTVSLHFTAMGAAEISTGMWNDAAGGISRPVLAIAVTVAALSVLGIGLSGAIFDRRLTRGLAAEARRFRTLADSTFEGIVILRDGRLADWNAAARSILGRGDESLAGADPLAWVVEEDRSLAVGAIGRDEPDHSSEVRLLRGDGGQRIIEFMSRPLAADEEGRVLAFRDVTARKESDERIRHLALHDPLTDLANRRLFAEMTAKLLSQSDRSHTRFAMLSVDLDGFRVVNDVHGHRAGDRLLQGVAERLRSSVRDGDIVARVGGDEFAILQTATSQPHNAETLAQRILDTLSRPIEVGDAAVTVRASIGIALHPEDGTTVDALLRNADTALDRAKRDLDGGFRFFEPEMDSAMEARRRLEGRIRLAVAEDGFQVHFQPLVRSEGWGLTGFEALARWDDPVLGRVPPDQFIPVAEDTGLIVPLGARILAEACREAAGWPDDLRVAVNLSPIQFRRDGLVAAVESALRSSGLPGERLILEITESVLIDDRKRVLHILDSLKALGVQMAMDDFGTGYSSLSYLRSFPFDKIKIDRTFVAGLGAEGEDAAIVRAVTALGHSLKMRVVAEGVETAAQAEALRELGCDELQGYLLSPPMTAAAVPGFVAAHGRAGEAPPAAVAAGG